MPSPKVSVIIPVHNGRATIQRAIESAEAQAYRPLEIVVVDDGSTDGTPDWLEARPAVVPTRIIRLPSASGGPARPRNVGVAAATGDLIALLDQDDYWLPDKLSLQVDRLQRQSADIVYSRALIDDATPSAATNPSDYHERWTFVGDGPLPEGHLLASLILCCVVPLGSALYRKSIADLIGGFDEQLVAVDDYDYWLRAAVHGLRFAAVPEPTYVYSFHPHNLSHTSGLRRTEAYLCLWEKLLRRMSDEQAWGSRGSAQVAIRHNRDAARRELARALLSSALQRDTSADRRLRLLARGIWYRPAPQVIYRLAKSQLWRAIHAKQVGPHS